MTDSPDTTEPDFAVLSGRVYRLCVALLGNTDAADDAAQEALTRAWTRRKKKRPVVSWWTWAAGFAVRVCRERRRSCGLRFMGHAVAPQPVNTGCWGSDKPDLEDQVLAAAIQNLPRRQKEVTVLRFLAGQSTREVAITLGCPEGTVKSNLHKAITTLRTELNARDVRWAVVPSKNC